ncbi:conjugal transfer protein TraD [Xenorhabdus hominickii]|uniref:conjugal transfer protein TraD n=1 Tax=Xenorhabdus hominickii TaxID=351679 RepID=UPI000C04E986|nr:conjugal transfer protein TraD [Xenorhabdus hominickii]
MVDSKTGKPVDDSAALLGALASLNELSRDNPKWTEWKHKGNDMLSQKNTVADE